MQTFLLSANIVSLTKHMYISRGDYMLGIVTTRSTTFQDTQSRLSSTDNLIKTQQLP
jgi:hypothetical protein